MFRDQTAIIQERHSYGIPACIICFNSFTSLGNFPILASCGHTFCKYCVVNGHNSRYFGSEKKLKCIIDRKDIHNEMTVRYNWTLFLYCRKFLKEVKRFIELKQNIENRIKQKQQRVVESQKKSKKELEQMVKVEKRFCKKLNRLLNKEKVENNITHFKVSKDEKYQNHEEYRYEKYKKLSKINEIKQARMHQLRYQLKQFKDKIV